MENNTLQCPSLDYFITKMYVVLPSSFFNARCSSSMWCRVESTEALMYLILPACEDLHTVAQLVLFLSLSVGDSGSVTSNYLEGFLEASSRWRGSLVGRR